MPLNPLFSFDQLPATSAAAIREFNDRYLAAVGASQPTGWADTLGEGIPTSAPMVTFPVSQLRTLYRRTEGESRFKKLREASFDVKAEEFDDGYEAKLLDLFQKVYAYRNWQAAPSRLLLAEEQFRHTSIAQLLDGVGTRAVNSGGTNLGTSPGGNCVDGTAFFSQTHPVNMTDPTVTGTWSNYQSTAKDPTSIVDLQAEVIAMQTQVPDENGQLLGVYPDTILAPADTAEAIKNKLNKEFIAEIFGSNTAAAATNNPYKGKFNVVPVKEFTLATTSTQDWYLVDSKMVAQGVSPWINLRMTVPQSLALRVFDEASDYFKNTSNIKMSSHIWYGFALAMPHAIRRIKGATR